MVAFWPARTESTSVPPSAVSTSCWLRSASSRRCAPAATAAATTATTSAATARVAVRLVLRSMRAGYCAAPSPCGPDRHPVRAGSAEQPLDHLARQPVGPGERARGDRRLRLGPGETTVDGEDLDRLSRRQQVEE